MRTKSQDQDSISRIFLKTISPCTNLVCLSYGVPSTFSTLYLSHLQSHKVRAPCMGQSRIAHISPNHTIGGGVLF